MKKKNSELNQLIFRLQKFQDWRRGKIDSEKYELNPKQIALDIDAAIAILKEIESNRFRFASSLVTLAEVKARTSDPPRTDAAYKMTAK